MLLDFGVTAKIVNTAILMYWLSLLCVKLIRLRAATELSQLEIAAVRYGFLFCLLISAVTNSALSYYDLDPGWKVLSHWMRG